MGPVSFQRVADNLERADLLAVADELTKAGIGVQTADGDRALLVRSEDARRAAAIIEALGQ